MYTTPSRMEKKRTKPIVSALKIFKNTILALMITALTLVLILTMYSRITGNNPSLCGYSLFRVSSGSMSPTLEIGDIILVNECDGETVKTGDIVTYVAESGTMEGNLVTHRVIEAPYKQNSEIFLVTKGDSNPSPDSPIKASQVEGRMITKISFLRYIFDIFVTPWGLVILFGLIIIAFFNEIVLFIKAVLGIGYEPEPKESVEDIIARYQKEKTSNNIQDDSDKSDVEDKTSTSEDSL